MTKSLSALCLTTAMVSALALSGCVTQQQADAKMGKGCEAAVGAMIAPKTILNVKATTYADEQTEASLYRRVNITATEKDGWVEVEKKYSCLFSQDWGLAKMSHAALLEQLVIGDTILGKKDGKIEGSMDDFMKLTGAAETAMGE